MNLFNIYIIKNASCFLLIDKQLILRENPLRCYVILCPDEGTGVLG